MTGIEGQPILTAAEMRAAEAAAMAAGTSVEALMEQAGEGVAEAVWRFGGGAPVLILCGPGNNGGDGYVAARILRARGADVRVAATGAPRSDVAARARAGWDGPVEDIIRAAAAPVLVDALFGTGLTRRLDDALVDRVDALQRRAQRSIAVDLPSGLDCDTGDLLRTVCSPFDLTLALGAIKPVHVLATSAALCGTVRVIPLAIDLPRDARTRVMGHPLLIEPDNASTKYSRGMVAVIGGAMPGAAALASAAALRSGAGYVLLLVEALPIGVPHAVVHRPWSPGALSDARIGAVLVGPGLGRDAAARARLDAAIASQHPLVIDGDALHLLGDRSFHNRAAPVVLTPHGGEFNALFGTWTGSKIDATRAAADRFGAVVVFKGADTVIADPSGRVIVAPNGSPWLATAGTGDVLAGIVAAMATSARHEWFGFPGAPDWIDRTRVETAVWLHAAAARRAGIGLIADDLLPAITAVIANR